MTIPPNPSYQSKVWKSVTQPKAREVKPPKDLSLSVFNAAIGKAINPTYVKTTTPILYAKTEPVKAVKSKATPLPLKATLVSTQPKTHIVRSTPVVHRGTKTTSVDNLVKLFEAKNNNSITKPRTSPSKQPAKSIQSKMNKFEPISSNGLTAGQIRKQMFGKKK